MRRILLSLVTTVALLLLTAQLALAAKPVFHEVAQIDEILDPPEELCGDPDTPGTGIPVTTHIQGTLNIMERSDGTFVDHSRFRITWTNAEGDWIVNDIAGQARFQPPIENPDGTVTFIDQHRGVHERLRTSEGLTPAFDRGFITFITTIDFGDPENPVLVDEEIIQHGPHPEADSGFALFCEVVTAVLG